MNLNIELDPGLQKQMAFETELSDCELLERYRIHNDANAFEELVRRHGGMVLGVCRRVLKHLQDAEDVFQATFLVLARKAASIREKDAVSSWLFGVASRLSHKARCAESARKQRERNPARCTHEPGSEGTKVTWSEVLDALDEELRTLPESYQAPLVLCYLEGRTHTEAAAQLGWSLGTLRRRLAQGRSRLQARLIRRGLNLGMVLFAVSLTTESVDAGVTDDLLNRALDVAQTGMGASSRVTTLAEGAFVTGFPPKFKFVMWSVVIAVLGTGLVAHLVSSAAPVRVGKPDPMKPLMRIPITNFAFSPDSKFIAFAGAKLDPKAGNVDTLCLRDLTTGKDRWQSPPMGLFGPLAFSPNGKVLAASHEGDVHLFDTATGKHLHHWKAHRKGLPGGITVQGLKFSPDSKHLAVVKMGLTQFPFFDIQADTVRPLFDLYDVAKRKPIRDSIGPKGILCSLISYRGGRILAWESVELQSNSRLVDLLTGEVLFHLDRQQKYVPFAAVSPDGKTCAIPASSDIRRWDLTTGKELKKLKGHNGSSVAIAFSPEGNLLASAGGDGTVRLWITKTDQLLRTVRASRERLTCMGFSPNGRMLVTGGLDKTIRVWNVSDGKLLHSRTSHQGQTYSVGFSPEGSILVSTGSVINKQNQGRPETILWKLPTR